MVRKLGYLRSSRIDESTGLVSDDDNAERLFAVVGLSLASVTKFTTLALVIIFATSEAKKHLENLRIGVCCWALLSALSTLWIIIEAFYRTMSSQKTQQDDLVTAAPLTASQTEPVIEQSDLGIIMVTDEESEVDLLEDLGAVSTAHKQKEMLLAWLFALVYTIFFVYCVYTLLRYVRDITDTDGDKDDDHKEQTTVPDPDMQYNQKQYNPSNFDSLWNRSNADQGFNSSPSTSISTISSCAGKGNTPHVDPHSYTDIDENDLANSYKSGSMPYPTGQYEISTIAKPTRYDDIDENHWPEQKIQMNQQVTKNHLMAQCISNSNVVDPKLTPGLETLLRNGKRAQLPIKSYDDSRQYTLRKTLPRNPEETRTAQTASMRMDKRPPSKDVGGAQWKSIVSYTDQVVTEPTAVGNSSKVMEAGAKLKVLSQQLDKALYLDNKLSKALTEPNAVGNASKLTESGVIPKVLSQQLERAYHLDKKLSIALQKSASNVTNTSKSQKSPTAANPISKTESCRRPRPNFRSVPIPSNNAKKSGTDKTEQCLATSHFPKTDDQKIQQTSNIPFPQWEEKTTTPVKMPQFIKPLSVTTGMPPINNFRPPTSTDSTGQETFQPPVPPRDHPAHKAHKELVQLTPKPCFPDDNVPDDHQNSINDSTVQGSRRSPSGDLSSSNSSTSIEGSISRSMSFASLNSKDSEFSKNSTLRSSVKCASLASQKKKVRWGNFQEEFIGNNDVGLSLKRNTPAKSEDAK